MTEAVALDLLFCLGEVLVGVAPELLFDLREVGAKLFDQHVPPEDVVHVICPIGCLFELLDTAAPLQHFVHEVVDLLGARGLHEPCELGGVLPTGAHAVPHVEILPCDEAVATGTFSEVVPRGAFDFLSQEV